MARKRLKQVERPTRKRLKSTDELIEEAISTPSRPDPNLIKVGPKHAFKPWELRKLTGYGVEKVYENTWLVVFSGPGYIDMDRCATRTMAQLRVSMFILRYPSVKVEWLKGESNASADNAARGAKSQYSSAIINKFSKRNEHVRSSRGGSIDRRSNTVQVQRQRSRATTAKRKPKRSKS